MKTRLTEMLGIKYPIMCGGMMRLAYPPLCAAISNAGGLGNLTASMYDGKAALKSAIREVRELTGNPFMVNVTILPAVSVTIGLIHDTVSCKDLLDRMAKEAEEVLAANLKKCSASETVY